MPVTLDKHELPLRQYKSVVQRERETFAPPLPSVLQTNPASLQLAEKEALGAAGDHDQIKAQFPHTYGKPRVELASPSASETGTHSALRVGVVLSGGQAPGGHNVIAGLYDGLKAINPSSVLFGFLDGPRGIFTGTYAEITSEIMDSFRNTGGFDIIGSGRDKIESHEQFVACKDVCEQLDLVGLVVIGGDDSNTNAAVLAEYFLANKCKTKVVGCPKTIDGDLKNEYIPVSFGFDTACRVFSEQISNICSDTLSTQKYWQFIRLMGRSASSITLECALQTHPNVCLVGEEVEAKKQGLADISKELAQLVMARANKGKEYGVVLLPEGLIEFMPEFLQLISEINDVLAKGTSATIADISGALSKDNASLFDYLPSDIQEQLILDRDPHGNVQVSLIETEKLLASTVHTELDKAGYKGTFDPQFYFCGYEGRSALPSPFDTTYTYVIGRTASALLAKGLTGLMVSVRDLQKDVSEWTCGGVPITMMCNMEKRKGKFKPVIKKALVELDGPRSQPFTAFAQRREAWAYADAYRCVGPLQLNSPVELCRTLLYELAGIVDEDRVGSKAINDLVAKETTVGKFVMRPEISVCLSEACEQRLTAVLEEPAALCHHLHATIVKGDVTQSSRERDAKVIASLFPMTHKNPLIELLPPHSEHATSSPSASRRVSRSASMATSVRVGVVFCGRQSPGAHNIVCGLRDGLPPGSELLGFVKGTKGLFAQQYVSIAAELAAQFKNQGGMHMLGRSVDRLRSTAEQTAAQEACEKLNLDALVLIGSARTHTDAAYLAEYFAAKKLGTAVIACPTGIGGEMCGGRFIQSSVGFDTHCRVSSEVVGNTETDGASNRKYYYFIRLNAGGHIPSHGVLEVALQTHPTVTLLTEEVLHRHMSLRDIANTISDVVCERARKNKNFGTILMPEGLLAAIPEVSSLLKELEGIAAATGKNPDLTMEGVLPLLTPWASSLLQSMPDFAQHQLLRHRQSDGRTDLDKVQTERLISHFVEEELARRKADGRFVGKFSSIYSIRSFQARSAVPTQFDCELGYSVGKTAGVLSSNRLNGYTVAVTGLHERAKNWRVAGAPLTALLVADQAEFLESGAGVRPRVPPAEVSFESASYRKFAAEKHEWATEECNMNPGPVQFQGDSLNTRTATLSLSGDNYLSELADLRVLIDRLRQKCRPGCDRNVMLVATKSLDALQSMIDLANVRTGEQ